MSLSTVVSAICILLAIVFAWRIVLDILKTIYAKLRKTTYEWETPKTFTTVKDWWMTALLALALVIGFGTIFSEFNRISLESSMNEQYESAYEEGYDYARRDYVDCPYCGEDFPENLAFETASGGIMCPLCAEGDLNAMLDGEILRCHKCEGYYYPSDSDGFGLCYDCCQKYISSCYNCSAYTYRWDADDFSLCPACAGKIFSDEQVSRAVESWFEG